MTSSQSQQCPCQRTTSGQGRAVSHSRRHKPVCTNDLDGTAVPASHTDQHAPRPNADATAPQQGMGVCDFRYDVCPWREANTRTWHQNVCYSESCTAREMRPAALSIGSSQTEKATRRWKCTRAARLGLLRHRKPVFGHWVSKHWTVGRPSSEDG